MEFYVTKKNKWKIFYLGVCFSVSIMIIADVIMIIFYPPIWCIVIPSMLITIFVIDIGPGLYLYKEYIKYNANSLFKVDVEDKHIVYQQINSEFISATFNEIKEIIVYIPPNNYRGNITSISMEHFSYARFELKNGKEFYVTCLMIPELKDFVQKGFSGVPVDFHRWWIFPSIRLVDYCRRKLIVRL